jgi:peptidoglycan/LPS O-acetylase OafA/YrhL
VRWRYQRIDATTARLFDSLRGASALVVVLAHAAFYWLDAFCPLLAPYLLRLASLAVMAFFVVSGFMITSSILRRLNQASFQHFDVLSFAIDRLRRLLPPLAAALLIMLVCYSLLIRFNQGYADYWSVRQALGALLFIQDMRIGIPVALVNGPLWSLSHEFWFYVVAALLASMLFRPLLAGMLLASLFLAWAVLGSISIRWLLGLTVWTSGAMLALLYHRGSLPAAAERMVRRPVIHYAIPALLVGSLVLWTVVSDAGIGRYIFGWLLALSLFIVPRYAQLDTAAKHFTNQPGNNQQPANQRSNCQQLAIQPGNSRQPAILPGTSLQPAIQSGIKPEHSGLPDTATEPASRHRIGNFSTRMASVAPFSYTLYVVHFPLILLWNELTARWQHSFPGVLLICITGLAGIIWLAKKLAGYVEDKQRFSGSV